MILVSPDPSVDVMGQATPDYISNRLGKGFMLLKNDEAIQNGYN